ncbi:MAG: copper chaperone PCu(A)C [Devosia sp.]
MTFRRTILAAFVATLLAASPAASFADNTMAMQMGEAPVKIGDLEISGAFARATLPNAPVGGGYFTVTNKGTAPDRLMSATSPAAASVTLHTMSMEGNVMKMRDLPNGIDIPAGAAVQLTPSGLHMMFEHLNGAFVLGKTVPVTLTFEKAGSVTINLSVLGIAASAPMAGMSM